MGVTISKKKELPWKAQHWARRLFHFWRLGLRNTWIFLTAFLGRQRAQLANKDAGDIMDLAKREAETSGKERNYKQRFAFENAARFRKRN